MKFLRSPRLGKFAIVSSVMFVAAIVGFTMGSGDRWYAYAKDRYQDLQTFAKVLNLVQQYYVEEVDTQKLIYGGIKGLLQELDPHTNFLPPDVYKEFETETAGEFGGIGIEITVQNDILTVISPIEDTPAWEAGIQAGDKIIEINGESTKGFSLAEAAQRMRGKKGSKVRMAIYRDGFEKPREFVIERATVKVRSVKMTEFDGGHAYIRLTSFIENTASDLEKALRSLQAKPAGIQGLVIDLRRNPGGLLDQAVKISDMFLESGVIVSTIGRNKKDKDVHYAKKEGTYSDFPIVILINEYSASASEILAGALQDNKRAVIMGQQSFGKGSVQSVVKLGDGSGLKLTVARYYTPSGRSIQAEGIKPDVALDDVDPEAYKKALIKHDNVRREQDIAGHLVGDREKNDKKDLEAKSEGKPGADSKSEEVSFWWKQDASEKDKKVKLSPREELLSKDYQVVQALNYLKVWKVYQSIHAAPTPAVVSAAGPEAKTEAAADAKAESKTEAKPESKSDVKPEVKPAPGPSKSGKSTKK